MAWEERNGKRYYYRKRRVGKTVLSEYVGAGIGAEATATLDQIDREKEKLARLQMQDEREQHMKEEQGAIEVFELTRLLTRAVLLLAGYHPHKGQWRKKNNEQ